MNIIKKLILASVLCHFIVPSMVYAQSKDARQERRQGREQKMQEMFSQLNLSEDQKKQIEANKKVQSEQRKASSQEMRTLRKELNQELMKPDMDVNKVHAINGKLKAFQAQMADQRINSILEVRKVLTPEQFSKFLSMMDEFRQKRYQDDKEGPSDNDKIK